MQPKTVILPNAEIRKLGIFFLLFSGLLASIVLWKYYRTHELPWQAYASTLFTVLGIACVTLGQKAVGIYRGWIALGVLLGKIVSPVVLSILYYFVLTPFGLIYQTTKRDPLGLKVHKDFKSYWREPEVKQTSPAGLLRQF